MFHITLFENKQLDGFTVSEKNKIISIAIKLSRQDFPVDIKKRFSLLCAAVIAPTLVFYFAFNINLALVWGLTSIVVLNFKLAKEETPNIEQYLEKAVNTFINQSA